MKFKSYKIWFLAPFFFGLCAFGANKVGNGGNIVFCDKKETEKNQLLDFYEAGFILERQEGLALEIALKVVGRLDSAAPKLSGHLKKRLGQISEEIEWLEEGELTLVKDSHHLVSPQKLSDCEIVQTAIRRGFKTANEKRFIFRKDIWDALPSEQQAGLLVHEVLYEYLAKLGEKNSIKVRKLNAYLFQGQYTRESFWHFIKDLEVALYP